MSDLSIPRCFWSPKDTHVRWIPDKIQNERFWSRKKCLLRGFILGKSFAHTFENDKDFRTTISFLITISSKHGNDCCKTLFCINCCSKERHKILRWVFTSKNNFPLLTQKKRIQYFYLFFSTVDSDEGALHRNYTYLFYLFHPALYLGLACSRVLVWILPTMDRNSSKSLVIINKLKKR